MKINYDKKVDDIYIDLAKGKYHKTRKVSDAVLVRLRKPEYFNTRIQRSKFDEEVFGDFKHQLRRIYAPIGAGRRIRGF